jgi:hypothetical protein
VRRHRFLQGSKSSSPVLLLPLKQKLGEKARNTPSASWAFTSRSAPWQPMSQARSRGHTPRACSNNPGRSGAQTQFPIGSMFDLDRKMVFHS